MSNQSVRMEVVDILREIEPDIDVESLEEDSSLTRDLGIDDSDKRAVAGELNQRFDLAMSEQECEEIDTVGGLVSYVESHIQ
ncbi:acyl carrier protein [Persicimonas caeni]|nr:acyl carrier protein [Persicimonas caeni]